MLCFSCFTLELHVVFFVRGKVAATPYVAPRRLDNNKAMPPTEIARPIYYSVATLLRFDARRPLFVGDASLVTLKAHFAFRDFSNGDRSGFYLKGEF